MTTVTITATFDDVWWDDDVPDAEPNEVGGWADPNRPHEVQDMPASICGDAVAPWKAANVPAEWTLRLPVDEAVEFLADFEGGIWDFSESEPSDTWAYHDGERIRVSRRLTAHVDGPGTEAVFNKLDES
jgi:hypothetical protein